jgi:hypothetical protein
MPQSGPKVIASRMIFSVEGGEKKGLLLSQLGIAQDLPEETLNLPLSRHWEAVPGNRLL